MTKTIVRVSTQDEMQILAFVARGDRYEDIASKFGIAPGTITDIKQRNPDTLAILKENLMTHRVGQATRILDKANKAIEKRLDDSDSYEEKLAEIERSYKAKEIDHVQYRAKLTALQKLTVSELTHISREMHAQTKGDDPDKDTPMNPVDAKDYLLQLAKALESGDEVVLERLIFRKD